MCVPCIAASDAVYGVLLKRDFRSLLMCHGVFSHISMSALLVNITLTTHNVFITFIVLARVLPGCR